jgi:5-methylcytosine-specific restriction protein A
VAASILAAEPLCRPCHAQGKTIPATLVDHITPLREGGERLNERNLQPLCVHCHAQKTRAEIRRRKAQT